MERPALLGSRRRFARVIGSAGVLSRDDRVAHASEVLERGGDVGASFFRKLRESFGLGAFAAVELPRRAHLVENVRQGALAVAAEASQHKERLSNLDGVFDASSRCVCVCGRPRLKRFITHFRPRGLEGRAEVDVAPVARLEGLGELGHLPTNELGGESFSIERKLQPSGTTV